MKKLTPFLVAALLLSACQEETQNGQTLETLEDTPVEAEESSSVDLENFFASIEFVPEKTPVGDSSNYISPFDLIENPADWADELSIQYPDRNDWWLKIQAQLEQDYPKFDPLSLLVNEPETLVKNFKTYKDEETVSLQDVYRMQTLKTVLESMQSETKRWQPGPEAYVLTPPEGFPGWYGPGEDGEPDQDQYLFYVDLSTWQETTEEPWKNEEYEHEWEHPDGGTVSYFDRTWWSTFTQQSTEGEFYLAQATSYEYSSISGAGAGAHNTVYAYDQEGRIQDSFTLVEGEGPMADTTLFTYIFYGYENDQLKFIRISSSLLEQNQLWLPRIAYYHSRYWAKAF